ncbi:hypothetical protein N781_07005 [Pontibacillus halophilus JSM 076056 = DSM 19796]|uniref:TVP38/TMEM64 family membrane protein n=1 Tax=Pontibacillus halophilus JSM 076056 = DSM 19796 TaxID=1385510 RepID=A0A0A5GBJ8_9BACI|nr:TVP38/TMEM64 family protein [Pontibacillus halophilus]KGX90536.1 hypothetical protein N781_07005 [Pontibacillus halophilus JSM 076056 = DSM 19796]
MKQKKNWIKAALVLIIFLGLAYFVRFELNIGGQEIKEFILSFGWWAPFIFFLIYTIGPIVFFPTSVLSLAAGLAFGFWPGVLYIWFGATGAAATGYIMARFFGDSVLRFQNVSWSQQIYKQVEKRGFLYVLILRLIPLVGFDILSYISGIARVRFGPFLLATFIGMLPGTIAYAFLGSSLGTGNITYILIAVGIFLLLILITYLFRARVKRFLGISQEGGN